MQRKMTKVLFFIAGPVATAEEEAEAEAMMNGRTHVCFRNASRISKDEALEAFDLVAGCAPARYADAAAEKGAPVVQEAPKADAATVPAGSPLAGAGAAKAPKPKPAGAGWAPNA